MSKKFKIKKQDYYSKDDIQIEISEEVVTPVEIKTSFVSVSNLQKTIDFLKEKKKKIINEIDSEIEQNQYILDMMGDQIEKVKIKPVEEINIPKL